jgi:hypothetical protein
MIVGVLLIAGGLALLYCRMRGWSSLRTVNKPELVALGLTVIFAGAIFGHVGFHGSLTACRFTGCTSTAAPWLFGYLLTAIAQPTAGFKERQGYSRSDWFAWLLAQAAMFLLMVLGGYAFNKFVYMWGREELLH